MKACFRLRNQEMVSMKLFLTHTKEARRFLHAAVVGVVTLLLFNAGTSCGNEAKSKVVVKGITASPQKQFLQATGYLPAFYLERADFLQFGSIKYKDKLVLQFQQQKDSHDNILAICSIADKDKTAENIEKVIDKLKIRYAKPFANALNISGKKLRFVSQRTKEDEYQKLLKEVQKYELIKYVIFEPEIEGSHIRYKITGVEKLPFDLMVHGFATKSYYSRSF
jgi:hypothetical protein